uniref:CUB domain-containing protein n=1 Tax=Macrostomum lignano TaxID=282301 RepID=A0A1I8HKG3_9PLAT
ANSKDLRPHYELKQAVVLRPAAARLTEFQPIRLKPVVEEEYLALLTGCGLCSRISAFSLQSSKADAAKMPRNQWQHCTAAFLLATGGIVLFIAPGSYGFVDRCDGGIVEIHSWDSNQCPPGAARLCPEDEFVTSPGWPKHYPEDLRCRYKLIGRKDEKVRLDFVEFNVEGLGPLCKKDFLDVHIQLKEANASVETTPLLGRFCGHTIDAIPRTIVSQHSVLVMDFYSDKNTQRVYNNDMHMRVLGFKAKYTFVPKAKYEPGHRILGSTNECSYLISSPEEGTLLSATYPGLYPDNMHCVYIFQAKPNQRVRLVFEDLDLYEIAGESIEQSVHVIDSCPVDVIRFYNSREQRQQIQGDFCGSRPNLTIFSSGSELRLDFISGVGRVSRTRDLSSDSESAEIQRRGFRLKYTMSDEFLRIDSPSALMKYHLNGTECDFLIESQGRSQEQLFFPPVRPGTMCRIFLQGVHNRQKTEVVQVELNRFVRNSNSEKRACQSATISAYLKGQGLMNSRPDSRFCQLQDDSAASTAKPISLRSEGPQMFLELRTGSEFSNSDSSKGFVLRYRFITDYGIPGVPLSEDICQFTYHSSQSSRGLTNSPLFNSRTKAHYPNNITCLLRFIADRPDELVRIRFTHFYVEDFYVESLNNDKRHHSTGSYVTCVGDRVELFDIYE